MLVTFAGSVSAQAQAGETITITITMPDSTIDVLTALTAADKTFTTSKAYIIAGVYSALFHIDADAQYGSADFGPVSFTIAPTARTITATITVT